jgi:hypothetical protein
VGMEALQRRAALMLLLVVGSHSLLEYPLWYAYFLLPTACAWGLCLAEDGPVRAVRPIVWPRLMGVGLVLGSLWAFGSYQQVVAIYAPSMNDTRALSERISAGQRTWLFSRQADYAAATAMGVSPAALAAAQRAGDVLIDSRLLIAWAKNLHAAGETDKARYLVARLQEFRKPDGEAWMDECEAEPALWHCSPSQGHYTRRDF